MLVRGLHCYFSSRAAVCRGMPFYPCCSRVDLPPPTDLCWFCVAVKAPAATGTAAAAERARRHRRARRPRPHADQPRRRRDAHRGGEAALTTRPAAVTDVPGTGMPHAENGGSRAFFPIAPVSQRHTADRRHLGAILDPAPVGLVRSRHMGRRSSFLPRQHPAAARAHHARAAARYACMSGHSRPALCRDRPAAQEVVSLLRRAAVFQVRGDFLVVGLRLDVSGSASFQHAAGTGHAPRRARFSVTLARARAVT